MAVYPYAYDSNHGQFVETSQTEVRTDDLSVSGEDLQKLFGDLFYS